MVRWGAGDLTRVVSAGAPGYDNLIAFARACPHRGWMPSILKQVEGTARGRKAEQVLGEWFRVDLRGRAAWEDHWRRVRGQLPEDLGSGWIGWDQPRG